MSSAIKKMILFGLGLMGVALLVLSFRPEPLAVDVATVKKSDLDIRIQGEGKSRVRDIYVVSAPIRGRIARIESEPGDEVLADKTILARMEPMDPLFLDIRSAAEAEAAIEAAEASIKLAEAQLEGARAERDFALSEVKRNQELAKRGNISSRTLERAQIEVRRWGAEVSRAEANLEVARHQREVAQAKLIQPGEERVPSTCCILVKAPVSGVILRLLQESEGVVETGTALMEVGDPKDLEVVVDMLSTDAVKIKPGDKAYIEHWGGDKPLAARVRRIEPSGFTKISALGIEEQRVNVILDFTGPVEAYRTLGDGYRVEAAIIIDEATDVMSVPISTLFRTEDNWAVFVLRDGQAVVQHVILGRRNDTKAEVVSGLSVGDAVIVHPSNKIDDGVRVRLRS
ncbi:MAG: efflux transporter periplasmic adaptor subunit [Kordiimonas sp.]|nr:efflux transporter periplasmic adaptor subunit [Kordiimonas sp.]|tara:strand:- start:1865 stop:3064 length:1200 start_codon:yes stop_codon:yes gene_type:complete